MTSSTQEFTREERRNRSIGIAVATAVYVLLFFLLWTYMAWRGSPPVQTPIGIELAEFGSGDKGSGSVQTHNQPSPLPDPVESAPAQQSRAKAVPTPPVPRAAAVVQPAARVARTESPVRAIEKPQAREIKTVTETKPAKVLTPRPVEAPPVSKPAPQVDSRGLYGKGKANGTAGTNPGPGGNNIGPAGNGGVGDYGNRDGSPAGSGLYGRGAGTGGGSSLSLTGWRWRSPLSIEGVGSDGRAVFRIVIDDEGNVQSVSKVSSTLSPVDDALCIRKIRGLSFQPTNPGAVLPATSTGTISISVRSR